jgi:isoquinoline 1-oxidoreductase beta subunit
LVAEYHLPFLAHGTMEPPNCTADVRADSAEIWIGSQAVERVVTMVQEVTKLPADRITVHTPFLGGGFGRRVAFADQVIPAVMLSQKVGKPVKLVFTREEDIQHDVYRPMTAVKLRAGFDAHKRPVAWHFTVVGDGPARNGNPYFKGKLDESTFGGLNKQPYAVLNKRVDYVYEPIPVPVGYWRSVEHGANAFCKECFVDEMAAVAGEDEAQFRRALLGDAPRHLAVLDRLLALSKWRPQRYTAEDGTSQALGLALHEAFGSIIGEVAEVSIRDGAAVVHRVWAVVDCGVVINPAQVEVQIQSAIVFGLTAALGGEIVIDKGAVQQSNFTDYPLLALAAMPIVEVVIIDSAAPPGGIGEGGTPPIAPAVVNALAKLTGERVRSLPLSKHPLKDAAVASPSRAT